MTRLLPILLAVAAGCASAPSARRVPDLAGARVEVTSSPDRQRLDALVAERAHADAAVDAGYRIGPDDLLEIRIPDLLDVAPPVATALLGRAGQTQSGAPVFQQGLRVSPQGDVVIPLLGSVPVAGRTPAEAQQDITRRLQSGGILRQPQVTVLIAEYRNRAVAVVGSVERPGTYPLTKPGATLADMVWAAGGPSKDAGRVVDFVPGGAAAAIDPGAVATAEPIRIDLQRLLHASGGAKVNPPLRAGDVISIPPAGTVQVDGWVAKPGSYPVTRGLTMTGAVAAAGGYLYPADRARATLQRSLSDGGSELVAVDLAQVAVGTAADLPITDGDVVRIQPSVPKLIPWGFYAAVRDLVRVGSNAF